MDIPIFKIAGGALLSRSFCCLGSGHW